MPASISPRAKTPRSRPASGASSGPGGEPRIRVSAILSWRSSIMLCRHEKPGKEYWLLPGGGVNTGESLIEALHRELYEEIGIDEELPVEGPVAIADSIAPKHDS